VIDNKPLVVQCFDLTEFKTLISIYFAGYLPCEDKVQALSDEVTLLTDEVAKLDKIVSECRTQVVVLKNENERLFKKWKNENLLRHQAESRDWKYYLAWGSAGALGISTAVLAGILWYKN